MTAGANAGVSAEVPDWSREHPRRLWDPSRRLLRAIRRYQATCRHRFVPLRGPLRKYWALHHRFWSVIAQAESDLSCEIGGGLMIRHANGIVIHPGVTIGPNCLIFQQVTLGTSGKAGVPTVGGHVDIGAGAKILGPVRIGDHARIGANAVVVDDVPAGATVTGIPARLISP